MRRYKLGDYGNRLNTPEQVQVMTALTQEPMTMAEIAEATGRSVSVTESTIRYMARKKLVRRCAMRVMGRNHQPTSVWIREPTL